MYSFIYESLYKDEGKSSIFPDRLHLNPQNRLYPTL